MNQTVEQEPEQLHLEALADALDRDAMGDVRAVLADLHPAEIALLLESLPQSERNTVWEQLDDAEHAEVLSQAEDSVRASRMLQMEPRALAAAASDLETDDAVDILQDLPEAVIDEVLQSMDAQNRARLELALAYPEDTAGGLMNIDTFTVRGDVSLETVLRYLRAKGAIPDGTESLMVVDRDNHYQGMLALGRLVTERPESTVEAVMDGDIAGIPASTNSEEVAKRFEQRDLFSAPVVDDEGRLLGRITVDDVLDVIRDRGDHSLMGLAGLDEHDDTFASVASTARRRTLWLGVNLATALLASWVIGLFEGTIRQVVALAVLMPVVASMGGIAGSQTLTVMIRGMALGQVGRRNARWLLVKEVLAGLINGLFWAVVLGVIAGLWFSDGALGLIIATALVLNQVVAAFAGASIPLLLRRLSIDPAVAGGVVLTTVTDVIGFLSFLGLGALFLVK